MTEESIYTDESIYKDMDVENEWSHNRRKRNNMAAKKAGRRMSVQLEAELNIIQKEFAGLDIDGNGDISVKELEDILRSMRLKLKLTGYRISYGWPDIQDRKARPSSAPAATTSAFAVSSAITKTSDGPAIISIPTLPKTCLFAAATYELPGPVILSTGRID